MIQMVRLRETTMVALADSWEVRGGGIIVAHYPTGQACIYGPMAINGPVNVYWEVHAENQATENFLAKASMSTSSMKSLARNSNSLRNAIRNSGRPLIKNSSLEAVGYYPAHTICGRSPLDLFMDGEDIETAAVLDLE